MKKQIIWFLILILIASSPSGLLAQQVFSLDSCISMALQTNKDILAAQHQQKKYEYEKRALRGYYFPEINVQATDIYSTLDGGVLIDIASPIGTLVAQQMNERVPWLINKNMQQRIANSLTNRLSPFNPVIDYKIGNVLITGIHLTQPLYMGGKIRAGHRMGTLGVKMAALNETLTSEQTVVAVHEAYNLLVKAKEMRLVALKYDSLLVQLTKDVQSALRNGMVSHNEEMKVMVKKSEAELKLRQAENGIRLARMNLCQIIGLPTNTAIDVETDNNDFIENIPYSQKDSIMGRTEYQLLELKSQLAEQQVKLETSNFLPQLGLVANGALIDGLGIDGKKVLHFKPAFNVGVSLKIPITHGNQARNKIRAAKEEAARQRLEQASLNEKMALELQQQTNNVEEAQLELAMRQRNLEQCDENLRVSRKAYSVGYETLSELLTAQLLWQQAYAELVESRYQLKSKVVKWRKAAGRLFY